MQNFKRVHAIEAKIRRPEKNLEKVIQQRHLLELFFNKILFFISGRQSANKYKLS